MSGHVQGPLSCFILPPLLLNERDYKKASKSFVILEIIVISCFVWYGLYTR